MSTAIPKVFRGSVQRPVGWNLYTDLDALTPLILPADAVVVLTLTGGRGGRTRLTKSSADDDGLSLYVGEAETETPAKISWLPTAEESRMFGVGRVHAEAEYWPDGASQEYPLLPEDAAVDFVNGRNTER